VKRSKTIRLDVGYSNKYLLIHAFLWYEFNIFSITLKGRFDYPRIIGGKSI